MRVANVLTTLFVVFACCEAFVAPSRSASYVGRSVAGVLPKSPGLREYPLVDPSIYVLFLFTHTISTALYLCAMSSKQKCLPSTASKNQYNLTSTSGHPCLSRHPKLGFSPISCSTGVMVQPWRLYFLVWEWLVPTVGLLAFHVLTSHFTCISLTRCDSSQWAGKLDLVMVRR